MTRNTTLLFSCTIVVGVIAVCELWRPYREAVATSATVVEPIPLEKVRSKTAPGAELTIRSLAEKKATDTRGARMIALHVPEGTSPTPFLSAGPFEATWKTTLRLKLRGKRTFSATGRGKLQVSVDGNVVLSVEGEDLSKAASKELELGKRTDLIVNYTSPAKGDASLRLYWAGPDFRREPVPPDALQHDRNADQLRLGRRLRDGRELLTNRRCLRCHQADTDAWLKNGGMPELAMDAPSLTDVGGRLREAWLARWIQDAKSLRPSATMPRVFADAPAGLDAKLDARARDAAAFLASLGHGNGEKATKPSKATIQAGTRLFADLGCIACHLPPSVDEYDDDDFERIPLRDVGAKWRRSALTAFLRKPDQHYQWIRMPSFELSTEEAANLSAFLTSVKDREVFNENLPAGNVERGRKLVEETGCLNCHEIKSDKPLTNRMTAPAFVKLTKASRQRGCMQSEIAKDSKAPDFALNDEQRTALLDVTLNGRESLSRSTDLEFATRRIRQLRCIACHDRDGEPSYWADLDSEIETLVEDLPERKPEETKHYANVQLRPPLTWAGEKLKPEWTTKLISGKLSYKPRPFLRARMPVFPRETQRLVQGVAHQHGYPSKNPVSYAFEKKLISTGSELASSRRWNCIGCHNVGDKGATAAFEAPGVNFQYLKERLQREYYDRWLWAPTRVWDGTKMPTVYHYGMPSPIRDVLDGDPANQIEALWSYFQQGREMAPPK